MITLLSKDQEEKLKGGFAEISVFPLKGSMEGQKNKKNVGCVCSQNNKNSATECDGDCTSQAIVVTTTTTTTTLIPTIPVIDPTSPTM